jgi:hypothetical protein
MTDITYDRIGRAFVQALCGAQSLGHVSATGLADYVNPDDISEEGRLVWAAFASARLDSHAGTGRQMVAEWLATSPIGIETMARCAEYAGTVTG